jgi:hypothetical protein
VIAPPIRFAALVALTLAGCRQPSTDAAIAPSNGAARVSPVDDPMPTPPASDISSAPDGRAIPQPLRGRWDASPAACAGRRGEMRLEVEADRLRFYESEARVQAVRTATGDSAEVDLAFEGEGERWTDTRRLRLLPDGRLSVETSGGSAERVRCG